MPETIPYVRWPTEFPVAYEYGPDSYRQPGVPRAAIHEHTWDQSEIYPETIRRFWVYVPAQYKPSAPASLMVFQDGDVYLDGDGRVPRRRRLGQPDPPERDAGDHRRLRRSR